MRPTLRLLFAALAVIAGAVELAKSAGNHAEIATGLGIIFAAIAAVSP